MARVRLIEVAHRAGVSPGAASLALNGKPGVSVETRELVRRIAREMGYAPSATARALVGGRSGHWGALYDPDWEIWPLWLQGVLGHSQAAGRHVVVHRLPSRERRGEFLRGLSSEGHLDGLMILDLSGDDNSLRPLWEQAVPTVVARRSHWFDCVEIHERLAQEQLYQLLSLDGRRRVVAVATRDQVNADSPRLSVWTSLSSENVDTLVVAEDSPEAGVQALNQMRRTFPESRAAFCMAGDRTAWGMLREARLHSLSVPGDLSIAGWGISPIRLGPTRS